MKKILWGILMTVAVIACGQDVVRGTYSYTYGDKESLVDAKQTCKNLAVKDAIESYYLYVESATQVENAVVKNDIIQSLAAGCLKNLKITDQKEEGRTLTMTVEAEVNPDEVKQLVENRRSAYAEKIAEKPEAAADTSKATKPVQTGTDDFAVLLSKYENRMDSADRDFEQKRYDGVLSKLQEMEALLASYQNRANTPFQKLMIQSISLRNRIHIDYVRFERNRAEGHRIRERAAGRDIRQKVRDLEDVLIRLQKLENLTEKQKAVRAVWIFKCRQLAGRIKKSIQ
jgi:hypothetical protein